MKITAGNPLERGKDLSKTNAKDYLSRLMAESFSGYLCMTIKGKRGLQEGLLVLHNGTVVSSAYEYFAYNVEYKADEAAKMCLNAMLAETGVLDSFSLSSYQVQLALTLNEEYKLKSVVTKDNLAVPETFSGAYESNLERETSAAGAPTREALMKKYGLLRFREPTFTRSQMIESVKRDDDGVEKLMNGGNK